MALSKIRNPFHRVPKSFLRLFSQRKKRFIGQHILGWILAVIAIVLLVAPLIVGAANGIRNDYTYVQFFIRFTIMLLLLKAFDVIFFDWVLLCNLSTIGLLAATAGVKFLKSKTFRNGGRQLVLDYIKV